MEQAQSTPKPALELIEETDGDRPFLARLYASTRQEELAPVPWSQEEKTEFLRTQFEAQDRHYRKHYADTRRQLIRVDGELAGRLYLQHREEELRVVDIALLPEYRGRGIGASLLVQMQDESARAGKAVRIHVEKNNPAYRLYQRLGFRTLEDKGVYDLLEWRADS